MLTMTKSKRRHAVDVDETAAALLAEHRSRCLADAGGPFDRGAFVFANDTDRRVAWKSNWVTKTFLRYQRQVGLRAFRLHDLRHFMATQMLDLGIPLTVVARRLDHRACPPRWTSTATSSSAETASPPTPSQPLSTRRTDPN